MRQSEVVFRINPVRRYRVDVINIQLTFVKYKAIGSSQM